MANNDILTQMLEAATRGGGLRGGAGPQSGQGGLEDLLGQVLGGGQAGGGSGAMPGGGGAASGGPGGSLGDILGQVLGGAGAPGGAAGGQAGGGGLGDILGQVLGGGGAARGGANPAPGGGDLGDILGQILGGGGQSAGAGRSAGGSVMPEASEALRKLGTGQAAAPPPQPMPTPSAPPSMPTANEMPSAKAPPQGGGMNDLVKYGGIAVLGVLAYKALRNWQAASGEAGAQAVPSGKGFLPSEMPGGGEAFSGVLVRSMIAAAQADGVVDKDEQQRIVGQLNQLGVNDVDRQQIANQLRTRIDPNELVQAAKTPEMGLEIYAASVLAITPDSPAERNYLDGLAARLGIQPGLKAQVEQMLGRAA